MGGKTCVVFFLLWFETSECSVTHKALQNRCEFNFTNGNWEEFYNSVPDIHYCVKKFSHCELSVQLKNYSLPAFPNATFLNFNRNLSLRLEITDSKIELLSPLLPEYSVFQNSIFHSVILDICDSSTLIGWQWKVLENLTFAPGKGLEFNVVRSKLVYLHSDFSKVAKSRLTVVRILKCHLRWLGKNVFAPFAFLKTLELRDNFLENVQRSHLPIKAPQLKTLDLGNNRLVNLPEDIFKGLNLQTVLLDGNNLKISEPLAQHILSNRVFVRGVIWPCNCNGVEEVVKFLENDFMYLQCYTDSDSNEVFQYWKKCSITNKLK